jgi:hypothetical protein
MKVLANLAGRPQGTQRLAGATPADGTPVADGTPPELQPLAVATEPQTDQRTPSASRPARRPLVVRRGPAWSTVALLATLSAAAGAAAAWFGTPYLRHGALVVTSEPSGAEIAVDGVPTGQRTPAVIEDIPIQLPHEVVLSGPRLRPTPVAVKPEPGRMALRVHALLGAAFGTIEVSSHPPGAQVLFDDRPVGQTPVTVAEVRLDQRHRIDLKLGGYEIDQVVVLPERDGTRVSRTLTPASPGGAKGR